VTKTDEFAMDPSVAPGRVLRCEEKNESTEFRCGRWPTRPSTRLGPVAGDASPMPPQQRVRGYQPTGPAWTGERRRDGSEQGPVVIAEFSSIDLSAQHRILVAQDDDLNVPGPARTDRKSGERVDKAVENSVHKALESASVVPGQRPRPNIRPPQSARDCLKAVLGTSGAGWVLVPGPRFGAHAALDGCAFMSRRT